MILPICAQRRIMRNSILISVVVILFFLSCASIPVGIDKDPEVLSPSDRAKTFTINMNFGMEPKLEALCDQAVSSALIQDWSAMARNIADAARIAPSKNRGLCLSWLMRMTDAPFPAKQVLTDLIELAPENQSYYQGLLKLSTDHPMSLNWSSTETVLPWQGPLPFSLSQLVFNTKSFPTVKVLVNGQAMRMVLDTGADSCILFADAAQRAGVTPVPELDLTLNSSNSLSSKAQTGRVESFKLGELEILNARTVIAKRSFGLDVFDGLIGWPVLCQLVMEMDWKSQTITLKKESTIIPGPRNYVWIDYPLVLGINHAKTEELFLALDTGARIGRFSPSGMTKLGSPFKDATPTLTGGINGVESITNKTTESASIFLDGQAIRFTNYTGGPTKFPFFNGWDGFLGSDLALAGVLVLDFPAGRAYFKP